MATLHDWAKRKRDAELARTLLERLDAGDELHREAAAKIRAMKAEAGELVKEIREASLDAYAAGQRDDHEEWKDRY